MLIKGSIQLIFLLVSYGQRVHVRYQPVALGSRVFDPGSWGILVVSVFLVRSVLAWGRTRRVTGLTFLTLTSRCDAWLRVEDGVLLGLYRAALPHTSISSDSAPSFPPPHLALLAL